MRRERVIFLLVILAAGCSSVPRRASRSAPPALAVHAIALAGPSSGAVLMDYIAYEPARHRVWVPAGNTGNVYVVDARNDRVESVEGFSTAQVERHGTRRTVGPSSATVGEGVVYVGNRGDSGVCAVGAKSLRVGPCVRLASAPDGLAYVASTKEVWVTTPSDDSIVILDAAGTLTPKAKIGLDGKPEGFAVDDGRGLFYTNLEDQDRTLTIDIKRRQVIKTWRSDCGEDGPKGLALEHGLNILFVACRDRVEALDAGNDGKRLSSIAVGDGVDNIDYVESRHELYAAAARVARLTIARLDPKGELTTLATVPTAPGARNAVATE
jgi:hypothetical protein